MLGPARLIKSITAIPSSGQALTKAGAGKNGPRLAIEIELRKMLPIPFFPARKVICEAGGFDAQS